ncbi:hypothetical protein [Methylobacterium gregans]|uniref:Uncharacterized protein n=1 Tax=Methylobacterium gregans TaxID=374424 RepID=A0AA37MCH9_9HYPH|nr:hypothetical protein [Methylobacterium gregans]MDQ0522422.1 hypothetical protein [Methylobacterium gregans]GJD79574.1 hypothetical protein NBEOAGPD_2803 [Methylobacterium gregans]GLS55168.1 hypothetical protein GCM10007886_33520 [Methylobacterium gregans]
MDLRAGRTPIADQIAARMAAAGGDAHFAPGAAYRGEGFDGEAWCQEVNRFLRALGYEVRMRAPGVGAREPEFAVWCQPEIGPAHRLRIRIAPQEMSGAVVYSICRLHRDTLEHGALLERERLGIKPQSKHGKRKLRVEPEEAAAPGMRP